MPNWVIGDSAVISQDSVDPMGWIRGGPGDRPDLRRIRAAAVAPLVGVAAHDYYRTGD